MNRTVELINQWGEFEQNHPDADIEDFCRHYLAHRHRRKATGTLVGGVIPSLNEGLLLKIIGRISKLNMAYANLALKGTGLNQIEEFGMLQTIRTKKNPKKTEIIYANLFELSSGTDMLNRMNKRGLIKEYADTEDGRSKRVELTPKGKKISDISIQKIEKNATMLMQGLSADDQDLCIQLLQSIEVKFSELWQKHKGKKFEEIYTELGIDKGDL